MCYFCAVQRYGISVRRIEKLLDCLDQISSSQNDLLTSYISLFHSIVSGFGKQFTISKVERIIYRNGKVELKYYFSQCTTMKLTYVTLFECVSLFYYTFRFYDRN